MIIMEAFYYVRIDVLTGLNALASLCQSASSQPHKAIDYYTVLEQLPQADNDLRAVLYAGNQSENGIHLLPTTRRFY